MGGKNDIVLPTDLEEKKHHFLCAIFLEVLVEQILKIR